MVNKCDEERLARRSVYELETALGSVRAGTRHDGVPLRVFRTSALRGTGIAELAAFLATHVPPPDAATLRRRERHFLAKAIAERYGRFGVEELERAIAALPPAVAERAVYEVSRTSRWPRSGRASGSAGPRSRWLPDRDGAAVSARVGEARRPPLHVGLHGLELVRRADQARAGAALRAAGRLRRRR